MNKQHIHITYEYPPIPLRRCDWCAYFDGEEEENNYGRGPTPATALTDLLLNHDDEERASTWAWRNPAIPDEAICLFMDGDKWMAVRGDFINLAESPAGFGDTMTQAMNELNRDAKHPYFEAKP